MIDAVERRARTVRTRPVEARLRRRYRAERRFRLLGLAAVVIGIAMLGLLLVSVGARGISAFTQTHVRLDVHFDPAEFPSNDAEGIARADYRAMARRALETLFPDVSGRAARRELQRMLSDGAEFTLRDRVAADPGLIGQRISVWLKASALIDGLNKGHYPPSAGAESAVSAAQRAHFATLTAADRIERRFNTTLFSAGDSREPELAGIWGAVVGSALTLIVTIVLAFPLGVMAAVYLEEFAPRGRITDLIEVNINNLAAVPSIVFGLLGLAVLLQVFGMPRSAPIVGGTVLALMTLPTIVIAARVSLQSVPPSIREAALALGASPMQTMLHHTLPLAMPGILTGAIIGMARALGETAPLLMIGMVAFVVDIPSGFTDPATVLPVQIFLWADAPERAFLERTSAAIIVLLAFLITMNLGAVLLRRKLERRW